MLLQPADDAHVRDATSASSAERHADRWPPDLSTDRGDGRSDSMLGEGLATRCRGAAHPRHDRASAPAINLEIGPQVIISRLASVA